MIDAVNRMKVTSCRSQLTSLKPWPKLSGKENPGPGMEPAANLKAAKEEGHPAENRRPDRKAGQKADPHRNRDAPVDHAREQCVADDLFADDHVFGVAPLHHCRISRLMDRGNRSTWSTSRNVAHLLCLSGSDAIFAARSTLRRILRTMSHEVSEDAGDRSEDRDESQGPENGFGELDRPGDVRVAGKAVPLRMIAVRQHGDDSGTLDAGRIIERGVGKSVLLELLYPIFARGDHVLLGSKLEATGGARLDASRLEADLDPVHAQRALGHLPRRLVEFRNVERTSGRAQ